MHIISGDLWAGAEAQIFTLLTGLSFKTELCIILLNEGELASRLRTIGLNPTIINEQLYSSPKITLLIIKAIYRFRPDVIHSHRQKENILGSLANLLSIPVRGRLTPSLRTVHGAPEFQPRGLQKLQNWLDQLLGRWVQKKIIAVSRDLSQKLAPNFRKSQLVVIHNGVDQCALQSVFQKAEFKEQYPHAIHIGAIGRLEPVKRIDIFLEMAAELIKIKPDADWHFHVIGDGALSENLHELSVKLGIARSVRFHGHRRDIHQCIASLTAIVMCSDHEGTPMAALEAIAIGTTLIAHNVGGLSELLADHKELLVDNHCPSGYAEILLKQIEKPINVILPSRYNARENTEKTFELYQSIIPGCS